MASEDRYQIIDTIAQGDYAVVSRAHDNELKREVAVKQIHSQYLQDPGKLDQYWKEAQLLASLEHPYIMTIYDIDRSRGWLILELMQGSLKQQLDGNPIDLESLRLSLIYMLHALSFLEKNNIVHGDVKPTNLMLDKNNRVKLGDFGIARRMTGDDGSVVKGTTKYMAPEVVSDQFGPVGPQSDLYSLGFSAFDLMCGDHFDSLFPGLNMFGRDQQIAWMMWHSAKDRRLPEINRVLEGVPDDLAYVIQKLTEKDPAKRYRSAEAVLDDLRASDQAEVPGAAEAAAAEEAVEQAAKEKKKRILVFGALALSMCLTIGMVFMPTGKEPPKQKEVENKPTAGVVDGIDLERKSLYLRVSDANEVKEIRVGEHDRLELNGKRVALADLRVDDEIKIELVIRKVDGKEVEANEVIATRPEGIQADSFVAAVDPKSAIVTLEPVGDGDSLEVYVPSTVDIWLNNSKTVDGRKVKISDLVVGDHVRLTHIKEKNTRVATSLRAKHVDTFGGTILEIDTGKRILAVQSAGEPPEVVRLPLADNCVVTLNGIKKYPNGQVVSLRNLEKGYSVSIKHDTHISQIDANHTFSHAGVIQSVDEQGEAFTVKLDDPSSSVKFSLAADAKITVDGAEVPLGYLRNGDRVSMVHLSADLVDPAAQSVRVTPVSDPRTWAILMGQSVFDRLPKTTAETDLNKLSSALKVHYRVPESQILKLLNKSIDEIRPAVTEWLGKLPADCQLIVYYNGHSFQKDGVPYLAEELTNFYKELEGGLDLQWLVDIVDSSPPREKVLLLDTSHKVGRNFEEIEPSSAELVGMLSAGPTDPVSASVTVIASCDEGERGRLLEDQQSGRFAEVLAKAFSGAADSDGDLRVSTDELFGYLQKGMATYLAGGAQTPKIFLPNPTPPRLSNEMKQAVAGLLTYLKAAGLTSEVDGKIVLARNIQPDQPDDRVAEGLLYLKHNRTRDSERVFSKVAAQHPKQLVPHQALAWQYFMQKKYKAGVEELYQLVSSIPTEVAEDDDRAAYYRYALEFAGVLRTFAMLAPERPLTVQDVSKLDMEVIRRGAKAKAAYGGGVNHAKPIAEDLLAKIPLESDAGKRDAMTRELRRLTGYHRLDFTMIADYIRANLNH